MTVNFSSTTVAVDMANDTENQFGITSTSDGKIARFYLEDGDMQYLRYLMEYASTAAERHNLEYEQRSTERQDDEVTVVEFEFNQTF